MGVDFSCSFKYQGKDFLLNKQSDPHPHSVTINGVNYAIIGEKEDLEEIHSVFKKLENDLTSVQSLNEFHAKLQPVGISMTQKLQAIRRASLPSLPHLAGYADHDVDIADKEGHLWSCTDRVLDPKSQGFLYTFKYKGLSSKQVSEINEEIQPAIEPTPKDEVFENLNQLRELGYSYNETSQTIILPDRMSLMTRWEKYREKNSHLNLPKIDIVDSEGIASDRDFSDAFFIHTCVLSNKGEFIHDQLIHIAVILLQILNSDYSSARYEAAKVIMSFQKQLWIVQRALQDGKLNKFPQMEMLKNNITTLERSIGALADYFSAEIPLHSNFTNFKAPKPLFYEEMQKFAEEVKAEVGIATDIEKYTSVMNMLLDKKFRNKNLLLGKAINSSDPVLKLYVDKVYQAVEYLRVELETVLAQEHADLDQLKEKVDQAFNAFFKKVDNAIPTKEDFDTLGRAAEEVISDTDNFFQKIGEDNPTFNEMWNLVKEALSFINNDNASKKS